MEETKKDPIVEKWSRFGMLRGLNDDIKVSVAHSFEEMKEEFHLDEIDDSATSFEILMYSLIHRIYREGGFSEQIPKERLLDIFQTTTVYELLMYINETDADKPYISKLVPLYDQKDSVITQMDLDALNDIDAEAYLTDRLSKLAIRKITGEKEK